MKNNQKGFGPVEGLLILVIIGLVGFIGWYVYHTKNNTNSTYNSATSTTGATKSTNPTTGWKSYSDDFVSFKYPSGWKATHNDNPNLPGTKSLQLDGPVDKAVAASTDAGQASAQQATISLTVFKPIDPHCNCKIYDVIPLSMPGIKMAKLTITSATGVNEDPTTPAAALVVTDGSVSVGATTLKDGVTVGSANVGIFGTVGGGFRITNVPAFEKSQSFQDLRKILHTISIK
jgi:hypothetical protein